MGKADGDDGLKVLGLLEGLSCPTHGLKREETGLQRSVVLGLELKSCARTAPQGDAQGRTT